MTRRRCRTYWTYSTGLAVAWALVLLLTAVLRGGSDAKRLLPVFGGFCIGWVSTTIARYVYPPPKRWARQPCGQQPEAG